MEKIEPARLHELLSLDHGTGTLTWRPRPGEASWNARYANTEALSSINGHGRAHGTIFGKTYSRASVVWAMVNGTWPSLEIDHINGDRADDRPCNMRDVSRGENSRNLKRPAHNTSGHVGVFWHKSRNKWTAGIKVNRKNIHLGSFESLSDAVGARVEAQEKYRFHENHGRP